MDATSPLTDLLRALTIWSGQACLLWVADTLQAGLAVADPWLDSSAVVSAHASVAAALSHWGLVTGMTVVAAIRLVPRLLVDR